MAFLIGTWNCSTLSSRRPAAFHSTVTTTFSRDGYWMLMRTVTDKVPWNAITITRDDRITYDPTTLRWVDLGSDDYGLYDVSTSRGWNGHSIVWTDVLYPKLHATSINSPTTLTRLSDRETIAHMTFTEPSRRKITVSTRCTKL